jgi:hypothetical protein
MAGRASTSTPSHHHHHHHHLHHAPSSHLHRPSGSITNAAVSLLPAAAANLVRSNVRVVGSSVGDKFPGIIPGYRTSAGELFLFISNRCFNWVVLFGGPRGGTSDLDGYSRGRPHGAGTGSSSIFNVSLTAWIYSIFK